MSGGLKLSYELSNLVDKFWWVFGKYTNKVLFYIRNQLNSYFELIYSDKKHKLVFFGAIKRVHLLDLNLEILKRVMYQRYTSIGYFLPNLANNNMFILLNT